MQTTLVIATNNSNKVQEIKSVLNNRFEVISLQEAGILIDIPEPFDSLEENAREKSTVIYQLTGKDCFSEDTGLEVEALGGAPGVKSARYAGEPSDAAANTEKLLKALTGIENRKARFRTVISLILGGIEYQFEGICNGQIAAEKFGSAGFGYDPVFIPEGSKITFAGMSMEEKNIFSHRKKALTKMIHFLTSENAENQTTNS